MITFMSRPKKQMIKQKCNNSRISLLKGFLKMSILKIIATNSSFEETINNINIKELKQSKLLIPEVSKNNREKTIYLMRQYNLEIESSKIKLDTWKTEEEDYD